MCTKRRYKAVKIELQHCFTQANKSDKLMKRYFNLYFVSGINTSPNVFRARSRKRNFCFSILLSVAHLKLCRRIYVSNRDTLIKVIMAVFYMFVSCDDVVDEVTKLTYQFIYWLCLFVCRGSVCSLAFDSVIMTERFILLAHNFCLHFNLTHTLSLPLSPCSALDLWWFFNWFIAIVSTMGNCKIAS